MKRKLYLVLAFCLPLALAISSCSKEEATEVEYINPSPTPVPSPEVIHLERETILVYKEYKNDLHSTEGSKTVYSYERGNGVSRGCNYYHGNNSAAETSSLNLCYENNRLRAELSDGRSVDISRDSQGRITHCGSYDVEWANGEISSISGNGKTCSYVNGNMISYKEGGVVKEEYTYDDKNSYSKTLGEYWIIMACATDDLPENACKFSKNNVLTKRCHTSSGIIEETNSYEYSDNGYPTDLTTRVGSFDNEVQDSVFVTTKHYIQYDDGFGSSPRVYRISTEKVGGGASAVVSGAGYYLNKSRVVLIASGGNFVQWQDGNTDNPRIVSCTGNTTYTATFE